MKSFLSVYKLVIFIRLDDWLNKFEALALAFLILYFSQNQPDYFKEFFLVMLYGLFLAIYSYLLNTYTDIEKDRQVGKSYLPFEIKKSNLLFLVLFFAAVTIISPLLLADFFLFYFSLMITSLATLYSLPKIYLKDKGFLGVIIPALTQGPLQFLFFIFFIPQAKIDIMVISVWLLFTNLYMQILHQVLDFNNDIETKIKTWVIQVGLSKTLFVLRVLVAIMLFLLILPFYLINDLYIASFISFLILVYYIPIFGAHLSYLNKQL